MRLWKYSGAFASTILFALALVFDSGSASAQPAVPSDCPADRPYLVNVAPAGSRPKMQCVSELPGRRSGPSVYIGASMGVVSADTNRSCTRGVSGTPDICTSDEISQSNTSFVGGVLAGVTAPPVMLGNTPLTFGAEFEALFPAGSSTSFVTPVTNLGPQPIDRYKASDNGVYLVTATMSVPVTPGSSVAAW